MLVSSIFLQGNFGEWYNIQVIIEITISITKVWLKNGVNGNI